MMKKKKRDYIIKQKGLKEKVLAGIVNHLNWEGLQMEFPFIDDTGKGFVHAKACVNLEIRFIKDEPHA